MAGAPVAPRDLQPGRLERAYGVLRTLVHRARDREQWERVACLVARLQAYHVPDDLVAEVMRFDGSRPSGSTPATAMAGDPGAEALRQGLPLRLLVVGGDESEARFGDEVRTPFRTLAPGLEIDFEYTPSRG